MKTNAYAVSLLLAAGLAAPGLRAAQPSSDTAKVDFSTVDKDSNGRLSKEEVSVIADLELAFAELDTDHDGAVAPPEFQRWKRAGKISAKAPDPATAPTGSAGAQHMPETN
jgi:hypothetical protein